ncbi:hypothetical protein ACFPYI_05845 [Halomarina salina]|uniref:Uncharacterized protein n=1 Tax=Halomarina salina TaxID=1872699 RepID=A0ABD5RK22_9EURY|nr:hypothetical protein [Halomarina salina]
MDPNSRLAVLGMGAGIVAFGLVVLVGYALDSSGTLSLSIGTLVQAGAIADGLVFVAVFFGGRARLDLDAAQ